MPWHIKENPTSYAIRNEETTIAYVNKGQGDYKNAPSNAKLIKSCPDMLEIIENLICPTFGSKKLNETESLVDNDLIIKARKLYSEIQK